MMYASVCAEIDSIKPNLWEAVAVHIVSVYSYLVIQKLYQLALEHCSMPTYSSYGSQLLS